MYASAQYMTLNAIYNYCGGIALKFCSDQNLRESCKKWEEEDRGPGLTVRRAVIAKALLLAGLKKGITIKKPCNSVWCWCWSQRQLHKVIIVSVR